MNFNILSCRQPHAVISPELFKAELDDPSTARSIGFSHGLKQNAPGIPSDPVCTRVLENLGIRNPSAAATRFVSSDSLAANPRITARMKRGRNEKYEFAHVNYVEMKSRRNEEAPK
ncbi:uncharacterized protein MELLADRAFT_57034 [Melampsora larici-populina 98AG31]|uniref:Uncharacterized protein n=1 Tax=Melampsora larici-populina (strain 98AG31 / pathotype 3-4-7) TaxID=747676 RepID=F4RXK7_MELLP|nr:uncharacterized protein MELLADRAFT_57034 [Melampsora larici-populina 98AG31]EGG02875.1 hypothetical protein MELLADRAFT_57034 [Melampsora larici-populina 98AG31]